MKQSPLSASLYDPSLTPSNARKKGYEYIDDVIYNATEPSEAMKDILMFCKQFGCKLGRPSYDNGKRQFFGLYMPKPIKE